MVASHAPLTGDPARNPGMCPDWEWDQRDPLVRRPVLNPLSYTSWGLDASIITSLFEMRDLKLREGKYIAQGHTAWVPPENRA